MCIRDRHQTCTYGVLHEVLAEINHCPVTEPTPRSLDVHFDRRSYCLCDCFCWMRARLACLLSLLTHNVDRCLIYQKLYLFWEFTRVKIGVSNITKECKTHYPSFPTPFWNFEAVPECCAQSLPVAASVTAPLKIPAQFDKLLLSPSSRGNTALQRRYSWRYSTAMSPLLPRYVPGVGRPWFTLTGA